MSADTDRLYRGPGRAAVRAAVRVGEAGSRAGAALVGALAAWAANPLVVRRLRDASGPRQS